MNAYQTALITCRAVSIALWWMAGVYLVAGVIIFVMGWLGFFSGFGLFRAYKLAFTPSFMRVIFVAVGAAFVRMFAASLSICITGTANFEGESVAPRRALNASEVSLARAGAGLILFFMGAVSDIPTFQISGQYRL